MGRIALALLLVVSAAVGLLFDSAPAPLRQTTLTVADVLAGNEADAGFARAAARHEFSFPADHGPHPDFRSEWWYFTGNLATDRGRPFGFQLTLFRFALSSRTVPSASAWRSSHVVLGHFAVSDIAAEAFYTDERMSRAALDLAGTTSEPPSIWIDDWRITLADPASGTWRLYAKAAETALELELKPGRPVTLQGDAGLSRKSAAPGNASYYYSISRLDAAGSLGTPAGEFDVTGSAWLDREWSTSALGHDQIGWDWFALQLDDDSELMFYRLRRGDGSPDPHSSGVLTTVAGEPIKLTADEVAIRIDEWWLSPVTGIRYPARWQVSIPRQDIELTLSSRLAAQEWTGMIAYWEGSVVVSGVRDGAAVAGVGYVELTGYEPASAGR